MAAIPSSTARPPNAGQPEESLTAEEQTMVASGVAAASTTPTPAQDCDPVWMATFVALPLLAVITGAERAVLSRLDALLAPVFSSSENPEGTAENMIFSVLLLLMTYCSIQIMREDDQPPTRISAHSARLLGLLLALAILSFSHWRTPIFGL